MIVLTLTQLSLSLTAGLLTGNELAVALFVHPTFSRLDDQAHARAAQAFARVLGKFMPFWYALVLLLNVTALYFLPSHERLVGRLLGVAALLFAGSIVFTILGLLPINNQVIRWDLAQLPANWLALRSRWDRLHQVRVVVLAAALTCVLAANLIC